MRDKLQAAQQDLAQKQKALEDRYRKVAALRSKIGSFPRAPGNPLRAPQSEYALLAEADGKAREAIDILERCQLYPSLHYVALCHYAEVLRSRAVSAPELNQEVRRCLERAVALLEQPRQSLAEEELMRAGVPFAIHGGVRSVGGLARGESRSGRGAGLRGALSQPDVSRLDSRPRL